MTDTHAPTPTLSDHTEETIRAIAKLRAEHHRNSTSFERALHHMTAVITRPWFTGVITVMVMGWMGLNLAAAVLGFRPIDPPPFSWLGGAISLVSLYMVILILTTQRREDQLAQRREMLILELALVGEQKTAKVIELLEEARRDNPLMRNRVDSAAEVMAQPVDPHTVLEVIKDAPVASST